MFAVANYFLWRETRVWDVASLRAPLTFGKRHPIQKLMADARTRHEETLAKRSYDVESAASRYRARRGRHPPPGFDKWVEAALDCDSIVVEDYFDRIYKDLTPFWGLDAETVRQRANSWDFVVRVRNGSAFGDGDTTDRVPWLELWTGLVEEFAKYLPDVDMPINVMDEPRLFVPFDTISELVKREEDARTMLDIAQVTTEFQGLAHTDTLKLKMYEPEPHGPTELWELSRMACGPKTPSRNLEQFPDLTAPIDLPKNWRAEYAYKGYVQNWTASMDPCLQPHLRGLHGTFVEPLSLRAFNELIPLFGGSKVPTNNEILIPGAMYLTDNEFYSGGDSHGPPWQRKTDGIVWRGDASGGRAKADIWHRFQRHRLVQMLNGTTVTALEHEGGSGREAPTFALPSDKLYGHSARRSLKQLGSWLSSFADCGFVHLGCGPGECGHVDPYLHEVAPKPMSDQYQFKFLPDADGNSFSARFRGFMRSTSMPLKATVYAEWHDDRLTPWVHFVPLDNTFQDLYAVLEYFADGPGGPGGPGDAAARFIAERGQEWAEKVLRREDMRIYVWRLLLEWARVCDENRHSLGYVDDLVHASESA